MAELSTENILRILAGIVLLAIIEKPLLEGMNGFVQKLKGVLQHICDGLNGASNAIGRCFVRLQADVRSLGRGVAEALEPLVEGLSSLLMPIVGHWSAVLATVTEGATRRAERILGGFIYLAALLAFVYADAALGFNTYAAITTKAGLPPPSLPASLAFLLPLLKDLTLPLITAFVVNALILGTILMDLYHLTDFARWPKTGRILVAFRIIAIVNIVFVFTLAACVMTGRFVELAPWVDTKTAQFLDTVASFAMNAITVPAIITTMLLWPAFFAFFVIWLVIVGLGIVLLTMLRWLVTFFQIILPLLANGIAAVMGWFPGVVGGVLKLVVWFFQLIDRVIELPVKIVEWCVKTITYLPRQLGAWLARFEFIADKVLRLKQGTRAERPDVGEIASSGHSVNTQGQHQHRRR